MDCVIKGGKLIISEGVSEICFQDISDAIGEQSVEEIFLPESLHSIHNDAFFDMTEIKRINIPESVREIGSQAFWGLDDLEELVIPISVQKIGQNAFCNCKNLTVIVPYTAVDIPSGWHPEFVVNVRAVHYL